MGLQFRVPYQPWLPQQQHVYPDHIQQDRILSYIVDRSLKLHEQIGIEIAIRAVAVHACVHMRAYVCQYSQVAGVLAW